MDTLLVVVAVSSLVLATSLAVVAWKLLRDGRERSAARVAALEALAFSEADDAQLVAPPRRFATIEDEPEPAGHVVEEAAPLPVRAAAATPDLDEDWDLRYRPESDDDAYIDSLVADEEAAPARRAPVRPSAPRAIRPSETDGDRFAPISVPESMFSGETPRAPSRRWAALTAVTLIVAAGAATVYGFRSDVLGRLSLPSLSVTGSSQRAPLELLSLRHTSARDGSFTVTGLVQNPIDSGSVPGVVAVVYLFDKQGRYFASGKVALPSGLAPGEESPFEISIDEASGVGRYRVGFRLEDGGVVAHVDRRGHEPAGTTGDSVEDGSPAAAIPTSNRGRVEGN